MFKFKVDVVCRTHSGELDSLASSAAGRERERVAIGCKAPSARPDHCSPPLLQVSLPLGYSRVLGKIKVAPLHSIAFVYIRIGW